ncbi:hypothetical protein PCASD_20950, partial [Puccinia coronata f. sp. avenae]
VWPGWRFKSAFGPFGGSMPRLASMAGGAGGKMANLAAQGSCMARLAVQNLPSKFLRLTTCIASYRSVLEEPGCSEGKIGSITVLYEAVQAVKRKEIVAEK